jgi:predicted ATPase
VGSIGDDLHMDYTAVGDTTNLASRMESMAGPGSILVSGNTYRTTRDYFTFEPLGQIEVEGKEKPQEAYKLVGASDVETRIGASMAKGLTGFVGRKNSMAVLEEAYEKARSGSGQVLGLVGEAGVGKSRLVLEFRNRLPKGEFSYLEGRCLHYGGAMAYLPILDIVRSYFGIQETDRAYLAKKKIKERLLPFGDVLENAIALLHDLLSLEIEDDGYRNLETRKEHDRMFEAIRDVLIQGSRQQPLIIAVEDVHWIDRTSEAFLDYLIEQLTTQSSAELVRYILRGHPSEIEIPGTIQGIISARMDRLEDNLKRIMQVASVIGRDFAFRILQTITDMREELKSHLLNLQGLEFIYEKTLFPELEYIFRHALRRWFRRCAQVRGI